jgi:ATP-binding cassette subfamily C protein CydD
MLSDSGLLLADEPTADLDAETASAVTDALLAAAAGRTLVVATHDAALAARMDRIVRIEGGRIEGGRILGGPVAEGGA